MSTAEPRVSPLGNYPAARVCGNLVFVSGLSARLPDNSIAGVDCVDGQLQIDVAAQTRVILEKLEAILREYGTDMDNCLDVTVFLTDIAEFDAFNKVYGEYFRADTGPARTTLAVKALPKPGMAVELKVIASLPQKERAGVTG
jgi:2-aminomuconate deaminase